MLELFYEAYVRDIDFYDTYGTTLSLCGDVAGRFPASAYVL